MASRVGLTITVAEIRSELRKIRSCVADFEQAHNIEDELWFRVLWTIGNNSNEDPSLLARMALRSRNIEFKRETA